MILVQFIGNQRTDWETGELEGGQNVNGLPLHTGEEREKNIIVFLGN